MRFSLLLFIFCSNIIFGQLSNKHWLPPLHARDATSVQDHYLYLSTPEAVPFSVKVTDGNGIPIMGSPFTISQGNPQTIAIGNTQPSSMFVNLVDVNTPISAAGLILEATKDFYATFKVRSDFHAEILVSKGIPGIGTSFRAGSVPQYYDSPIRNFVTSFMATEDNTTVTVSDYDTNVVFVSGFGTVTDDTQTFFLNKGQSVVLSGYANVAANYSGFIGALITSDNPIAVSTGNALGGTEQFLVGGSKQDFNLDQIVSYDQIGTEYIVVKGNGLDSSELPLVIATQDNTAVFVNGNTTPIATLNAGEYFLIPTSNYQGTNNKNMYITSSSPVYLYQIIAGNQSDATTGLNFIPPLSCFFQKSVDLIPSINSIGNSQYMTDIIVLTYNNSTITINGVATTSLPEPVIGNTDWVTYRISGYTGNVVVASTGPLAVGIFGTDGQAVGFSGYYSGFGSEPKDTNAIICSSGTTNLLDEIEGNPETGGTWTPPLASGTDIFDPTIDLEGVYNYVYVGDCDPISVFVTVTIQEAPFAGNDVAITVCENDAALDLFALLGNNVSLSGTWSPAMASGTGLYNPSVDAAGDYTYTIEANEVCEAVSATISITKNAVPTITSIANYEICDDAMDGDDTNGFATFDLTTKTSEVLNGQTNVTVSYHINLADAENNLNPQTAYYATNQLVYVRLTNTSTACFATTSFDLVVNPLPVINEIVDLKQCDADTDAITSFNLIFANPLISTDNSLSFSYFTTENNALNNINPIVNFESYTAANMSIVWARVVNQNNCFNVSKINLIVTTTNPLTTFEILACDEYIDSFDVENDGFDYFDLTLASNQFLSQFPANQNLQISYYETEADAYAGNNPITELTNYRNSVPNIQFVWVRIDSAINNECFGLGPFLKLIVNPIPNFDLGADFTVCVNPVTGAGSQAINATPLTAGNYSYNWTPTNPSTTSLGNQSPIYSISQSGVYSVVVTNLDTQCPNFDSIEVTLSSEPVSVSATLITPFFSPGLASIQALTMGGFGVYEYSIDNGLNWQNSPVFNGLQNGSYIILVRDIDSECGIVQSQEIRTITYPAFFTPNGDGFNEYWNINGLLPSYNAKIYIFDRFGKFLKELKSNGEGWDGTYNGNILPSTDYWFKIEYTENMIRKEFKSHFALKR